MLNVRVLGEWALLVSRNSNEEMAARCLPELVP